MKKRITALLMSAVMTAVSFSAAPSAVYAEPTELFNDTFEEGYDGWAARGDEAVISIVSDYAHSGDKSLFVTGRTVNWNGAASAKIRELRAGQSYDLSAWVMYDDENGNAQEQLNLQMLYKDSTGTEQYKYISNTNAVKGEWSQIKGTVTIPEDATGVTIYIEANNATLDFYIDDIIGIGEPAEEGDSTEGFFDDFTGDTMLWSGRGDAACSVASGQGVEGGDCLFTEGRTKLWNGPSCNKTLVLNPGGYYRMSGWVKYEGADWTDTQAFTMNLQYQQDGKECYVDVGKVTAVKGEWAYIEANYTLPADADNFVVYFQTAYKPDASVVEQDLMDFYIDDVRAIPLPAPEAQLDIPSLKDVYEDYFILGGSCSKTDLDIKAARDIIVKHYDSLTFGNTLKPDYTLDKAASQALAAAGDQTNPQVNIDQARAQLDFCAENNIPVRGHVLVWHSQTPDWFFKENYADDGDWVAPEIMNQRLENYIKNLMETLAEEYPTVDFYAWDVVNEAFSEQGTMREAGSNNLKSGQSAWMSVYGDSSFINKAFEYARKYAPAGCKLFYNDYNEYAVAKRDAIIEKCAELKAEGNIDGIGMQSHISMSNPTLELYEEAFRKYNELGLEIHVTELDIDQKTKTEESMLELAKRYQDVFKLYKKLVQDGVNITAVVTWGISDRSSWIGGYPNLFDEEYQAKEAFYAICDTDAEVKLIQTANAVLYDPDDVDGLSNALEYQKLNTVGNGGFKLAYDGNKLYLQVYNPQTQYDVSYAFDPSLEADLYYTNTTNDDIRDYDEYVFTVSETDISSFKFDIKIGDTVWNGYDFENQTGAMGTVNVVSMPRIAEAAYGTPVIDGEIDAEWDSCTAIETDKFTLGSSPAAGTSRMMWDSKFIYILTEVKDPVLSKASANTYEQDTVEVFFDENNGKTTAYEADDIQCRVNFDNEKSVTDGRSVDDFISAAAVTDSGYIVEIAIPYTIAPFQSGQVVGFDVQINDDGGTGERSGIANWSDITGMGYTNTTGFGVLKLTGTAETVYGDADLNGSVGISDVVAVMCYAANSSKFQLGAQALDNCDVYQRGDGVGASDALSIQKFLAQIITELPESFVE